MPSESWYLLIHRIPAKPLYLRAKVGALLGRAGAVALKKSVYALPRRKGALEGLEKVAEEIRKGGGDAFICEAQFPGRNDEAALLDAFREQRRLDYARVTASAAVLRRAATAHRSGKAAPQTGLVRLERQLEWIRSVDFFAAEGGDEAAREVSQLKRRVESAGRTPGASGTPPSPWAGRTWVTRRGILVDRIACAWFIRRFFDESARFRFAGPHDRGLKAGEVGFDMPGAEFTHEGDRCSLETMIARTGISDPALDRIAEIVHDLDLKDGKFDHPEAAGVAQLLVGMVSAHPDDRSRLERGLALFDDLHRSWSRRPVLAPPPALSRSPRGRKTR